MSGFLSFWATSARSMSVAVTGSSGTCAAGPALAAGAKAAAGAAAVGAAEDADGASPPLAGVGSGSSSTGSTS